jgi:hypothetical protein
MTQQRYVDASRDLLEKARQALEQGDLVQASEKGWGAAAQAVKAIAQRRGWRHNGHRELFQIIRRLANETGETQLWDMFHVANSLHSNFYENWLPREGVEAGLERVNQLVEKLEALAG